MKRLVILAALLLALAAGAAVAPAAHASPARPAAVTLAYGGSAAGNAALNWAESHALGHPYCWAGAGPYCYDCSGLVMAAFGHGAGIWLPHSTYEIPYAPHVHWIPLSQARRGDILAFGSGHMELDTRWYHMSFGAHHSGTTVGWRSWDAYYQPTAAYRVYLRLPPGNK
jgi:cell wall-associated NlpC family hydrolase